MRGEFEANGVEGNTKTLSHTQGALVMFYTGKGNSSVRVGTVRSDGGDYQEGDYYKYNCATSMFYTFTGAGTRTELDKHYTVFGRTSDFSQMQELLDAVQDYIDTLGSADAFDDRRPLLHQRARPLRRRDGYHDLLGREHLARPTTFPSSPSSSSRWKSPSTKRQNPRGTAAGFLFYGTGTMLHTRPPSVSTVKYLTSKTRSRRA